MYHVTCVYGLCARQVGRVIDPGYRTPFTALTATLAKSSVVAVCFGQPRLESKAAAELLFCGGRSQGQLRVPIFSQRVVVRDWDGPRLTRTVSTTTAARSPSRLGRRVKQIVLEAFDSVCLIPGNLLGPCKLLLPPGEWRNAT